MHKLNNITHTTICFNCEQYILIGCQCEPVGRRAFRAIRFLRLLWWHYKHCMLSTVSLIKIYQPHLLRLLYIYLHSKQSERGEKKKREMRGGMRVRYKIYLHPGICFKIGLNENQNEIIN